MKRYQILFSGKVQGVGFRYFMQNFASTYHCTGYVKNLSDGKVLAELQGDTTNIEHVLDEMQRLKHVRIDDVKKYPLDLVAKEKSFKIIY